MKKCQNTHENSRGTWPRTVAYLRLIANLSWLLPSSRSKVSILLVNVTATPRMTLFKIPAWRSAVLNGRFHGSSESTAHYFSTHLLSDYFLLSAYFLTISCYKRMRLTTSAYGITFLSECTDQLGKWSSLLEKAVIPQSKYEELQETIGTNVHHMWRQLISI